MRKRLFLFLLMALFAPLATMAQSQITTTVCNGTTSNSYIPVYGLYVDTQGCTSEFIIPADAEGMDELVGGTISKMTFYLNSTASEPWGAVFQVYVTEVNYTTLSSVTGPSIGTVVYTGTLDGTQTTMDVEFDLPYLYQGGNLLVGTYVQTASSNWKSASFYGITAANAAYYHYNSYNSSQSFIPKTTFTFTPSADYCEKPQNLQVTWNEDVPALQWDGMGSGALFNVQYKKASETEWTDIATNYTGTSLTLDNLMPSTDYVARLQHACNPDHASAWVYAHFTTPCGIISIAEGDYEENFDNYNTNQSDISTPSEYPNDVLPHCWQFLNRNEDGNYYPQVYLAFNSDYAVSGNCLFFRSSSTTPLYAILPEFAEDISGLQLTFTYRNEGTSDSNGTLYVGYMTDPSDATTFTTVFTCAKTTTLTEKKVLFTNAPDGSFIAFMYQGGSYSNYYLSIDNVSVEEAPTCLPPTNITATNITSTTAELNWTPNSGESMWTVYYKKENDTEWLNASVSSIPFTLNGLELASSYVYYVEANCSENDSSDPSEEQQFFTLCDIINTFPWMEDFEDYASGDFIDPCWVNEHISGVGTQIFKVYTSSNGSNSTHQLQLPDQSDGTMTKLRLPEMNLPGDNYEFVIDVYRSTSYINMTEEGVRVYASADGEIEGATELAFIPRLYSEESGIIPAETTGNAWYTYELPINMSGTCYIILRGENQYGTSTFMDNFQVKRIPTCLPPTDLHIVESSLTAHNVTIEWNAEEGEAFQYAMPHGIITDFSTVTLWDPEVTNTATYINLDADSDYTFVVRKYCSETDQSEIVGLSFHTFEACPTPSNLAATDVAGTWARLTWGGISENYTVSYRTKAYTDGLEESFDLNGLPSDWENKTGLLSDIMDGGEFSTSTQWSFGTSNGVFDNHARINIYGSSRYGWLITPEISLPTGAALSFDLALTAYSGSGAASGTCDDDRFVVLVYADNAWQILREWNNSGSSDVYNNIPTAGQNVSIDLSSYAGKTVKIAFYGESTASNGDNNLHIDNVAIGNPVAAGEWQTITVEETTGTLTGLTPETLYEAKVQGDCGDDGISDETNTIVFTTLDACPTPTGLVVSNIGNISASVAWNGYSDSYNVILGKETTTASYLNENFANGIPTSWTNASEYPWTLVGGYMQSSNAGNNSTTSSISVTVTFTADGIVEFDAECMGEGSSTYYDHCDFYIDETRELYVGANISGWNHYRFDVTAGEHTFTWSYTKDSSVNPDGDYFAIDNVVMCSYNLVWDNPIVVESNTYDFDNLTASTNYFVKVQGICEGESLSEESEVLAFSTLPYKHFIIAGEWNEGDNWEPAGVPEAGDDVFIDAAATIPANYVANVGHITMGDNGAITIADGGQLRHTNASTDAVTVTLEKVINGYEDVAVKSGYYFIAPAPFIQTISPNSVTNLKTNDYDLYSFSAAASDGLEWINLHDSNNNFRSAHGYLYANSETITLSSTGSAISITGGASITLQYNPEANYSFNGWNLAGNPYVCNGYVYITNVNNEIVETDFYRMNEAGDGYDLITSTDALAPFEGVFVQLAGEQGQYSIRFSPNPMESNTNGKLNMNLSRNGKRIDMARIRFGQGQNFGKMTFRENSSKVYMPVEGKDYATVFSTETMGEMPVSFKAENNGDYTLSFTNEDVEFTYLHLIDNLTGEDVDLLASASSAYTFKANTTDYAQRFKLVFATGTSVEGDNFSFVNASGNLCIFGIEGEATVQVIDILGHVISSETFRGSYERKINGAPGVYMVRLINGNDVKVQKVVVR